MTATTSRWSRRFVLVGVVSLCCWQIATLVGAPRDTAVSLAVFGFVFHVVFGKAYALVPAYFDAELAVEHAPSVQFPLTVVGTACLAIGSVEPVGSVGAVEFLPSIIARADLAALGSVLWLFGVVVFVGTLAATIAGPLRRGETGTGEHNADRRPLDRFANAFVPVVLGYLLVGSYETAAVRIEGLPSLFGVPAAATHLLAAGAATLLVFALGFRLLPRFFGAHPSRRSAAVVLVPGAAGPVLLAAGLTDGRLLTLGAGLMTLAVVGFATVVAGIVVGAERRRVGLYGVGLGAAFGVVGVALGAAFALETGSAIGTATPALIETHLRVNLLGFLGLTIVGVSFQFYPPRVGVIPGASNELAVVAITAIAGGVAVETLTVVLAAHSSAASSLLPSEIVTIGHVLALAGALCYAYLVVGVFAGRSN